MRYISSNKCDRNKIYIFWDTKSKNINFHLLEEKKQKSNYDIFCVLDLI